MTDEQDRAGVVTSGCFAERIARLEAAVALRDALLDQAQEEQRRLEAEVARLRAALTRAAAMLDTVLDYETGARGIEVSPSFWCDWVTQERDKARVALDAPQEESA